MTAAHSQIVAIRKWLARPRTADDGGKSDPSRASGKTRREGSSPLQKKEQTHATATY